MSWEWVALILGLVFNLAIIMIAMSEGVQGRLHGRNLEIDGQQIARASRSTTVDIESAVPTETFARSTRPHADPHEW